MRILDKSGLKLGLAELGFFADDQQTFERIIGLPDGILLVTGPTGSGKTTTLYSCLNYINRPDRKIITVEDPVEYMLAGINQVQVHEQIGFTFAARAALDAPPGAQHRSCWGKFATWRRRPSPSTRRSPVTWSSPRCTPTTPRRGHPSHRHRGEALPGGVVRAMPHGAASGPQDLQELRRAARARPRPRPIRSASRPNSSPRPAPAKGKGCGECNKTGCRGRFGIFEIFIINDEARKMILRQGARPTSSARRPARWACARCARTASARSWPA